MNYRHSYHAGNVADVFKHYVLTLVLHTLHKKPAPFCVLDTHAGSGAYALGSTGEFEAGIGVLWPEREKWPALADYFNVIEQLNGPGPLRRYPGSPLFIRAALRASDRAVLVEWQPQEYAQLKALLHEAKNSAVHHADAWQSAKAFIPPREQRGVVLIDPPYEHADEFERVLTLLRHGVKHWRQGVYLAWYPIKNSKLIEKFYRAASDLAVPLHAVEFTTLPTDVANRLNGSGLLLINPPWPTLDTLREVLPALALRLADKAGRGRVTFAELAMGAPQGARDKAHTR